MLKDLDFDIIAASSVWALCDGPSCLLQYLNGKAVTALEEEWRWQVAQLSQAEEVDFAALEEWRWQEAQSGQAEEADFAALNWLALVRCGGLSHPSVVAVADVVMMGPIMFGWLLYTSSLSEI